MARVVARALTALAIIGIVAWAGHDVVVAGPAAPPARAHASPSAASPPGTPSAAPAPPTLKDEPFVEPAGANGTSGGMKSYPNFWGQLGLTLFVLLGVMLLIPITLRLLYGRSAGLAGRRNAMVKVLERQMLQSNKSVYVIEAAGRYYLIGVADAQMTTLAELDAPTVEARLGEAPAAGSTAQSFTGLLGGLLGRRRATPEPKEPS